MRTPWKRAALGLMIAGALGTAALGLARPTDPPATIPHADDPNKVPDVPAVPVPLPAEPAAVVQVKALEPVLTNDPAVALEWSGPAVTKVNTPTEYTLTVRNACGQNLQKVTVQVRAPKGTEITGTKPAVKPTDGVYLWDIGDLDAKTSKAVAVTLSQPTRGDLTCQAWVTFTGSTAMKAVVREPKLAVTIKAPEKVVLGDNITVEYTVTNTGDYPADEVRVFLDKVIPSCGWNLKHYDLPERVLLKPGESHTEKRVFAATSAGLQKCLVTALGAGELSANAESTVQVLVPKLDVSVSGPKEGVIGTKGKYTITVTNTGEVTLSGVGVQQTIPAGFKVSQAGDAITTAETLRWFPGELAPGASKSFEFEGSTHIAGQLTLKVVASGDHEAFASGECVTKVEGIPGLRMELVDSVDPVEKNGELTYEIKVTNTGTKADSDVVIVCHLPKELQFVSCSGPTKGAETVLVPAIHTFPGGTPPTPSHMVTFDPISDLAAKTEAVFKVKVKAVGTGDVRFEAAMTSKHLTASVKKQESTRVYGE